MLARRLGLGDRGAAGRGDGVAGAGGFWSVQVAGDVQGVQGRMVWWEQTPETQESVVQAFWSSQSVAAVAVVQGVHASIGVLLQAPLLHWSSVQALWSSQSATVAQRVQPAIGALEQTPLTQVS